VGLDDVLGLEEVVARANALAGHELVVIAA
jgi:hypothetical protein